MPTNHLPKKLHKDSDIKNLVKKAVNGEKILAALDAHTMTMETVLANSESQQVSIMRKTIEQGVIMFVAALVKEFSKTTRTVWGADGSDGSTQDKYIDVAINMVNEFYYWKLEEFAVFFRNAMKGRYKRPYGNIDMEALFIMGSQYSDERAEFFQKQRHNKSFSDGDKKNVDKEEFESMKGIFKDMMSNTFNFYKKKDEERREHHKQVNHICQDIMKEFDVAHVKETKGQYVGGTRYVTYGGKILNESEYLSIRFEEKTIESIRKNKPSIWE